MANIYTGNGLKIFYNEDTANRLPQNAGNEQISEIAAMPTLHIAAAMAQVETYDSEYVEQLAGEQNVDPVEITVNYIPSDDTHKFLDEATETQKEFQLILIRRHSEGTLDYSLMNGRISAASLSGDKDAVVQKTYTFTSTEMIVRDATALASVELYEGSYGVGSNGVDVPQYEPVTPTGNSFIKVPADQVGNPVSADMMGIGLIDGNTFSSLAMTKSGSLAIYAKNQSTAWTRILTSNLGDSKYVALTGDQSIDGTKTFIKGIYVDSLTASNGISGKSLTVTESITGESITVNNSTLGTAQADNLTLGQPLSVANGGTGSKNATDARSALGVKAAGTFDIVPIANGGTNASTALQARINLDLISKSESDTRYLKTASNLSDLSDIGVARSILLVQGLQCNSDTASGAYNALHSPNGANSLRLANDGGWRYVDTNGNSIPLGVANGGTGSTNVVGARTNLGIGTAGTFDVVPVLNGGTGANNVTNAKFNLQLDRLHQADNETMLYSPDKKKYFSIKDIGTGWGLYSSESGVGWIPLGIAQGGTGRTDGIVVFNVYETNGTVSDGIKIKAPNGGNGYTCYANTSGIVKWRTGYNSSDDELNFYNYTNDGSYNTNPLKLTSAGDAIVHRGVVAESLVANSASYPRIELVSRDRTTAGDVGAKVSLEIPNSVNEPPYFVQRNLLNNTGQIINNLPSIGGNLLTDNAPKLGTGINANEIYGFKSATFLSAPTASTNLPFGGYGVIGSMGSSGRTGSGSYSSQMCWDKASGAMYTRVKDDLTNAEGLVYTPWVRVTTSAVSDERLKNIKGELNVQGALDNINRMEFKIFTFKNDETQRARRGVIAQQVREIDKDYTWQVGEYLHLDPTPLILDGLAAIQALSNQNDSLVEKIEDQQQQIDELKALVQQLLNK